MRNSPQAAARVVGAYGRGRAGPEAARQACQDAFAASLRNAVPDDDPFRHWVLSRALPEEIDQALIGLPFPAPSLGGISGARELHNNSRRYFDSEAIAAFPVCRAVAEAFQSPDTVAAIEALTGARLDGTCLRIEFAQDTDGFWLAPHTDLGVKKFTLLYYLAQDEAQRALGTDVYRDADTWAKRIAFEPGAALAFVPSDRTWHGFEPRTIEGVRKSVIINYVTGEWRAREQLAYPQTPVRGRR